MIRIAIALRQEPRAFEVPAIETQGSIHPTRVKYDSDGPRRSHTENSIVGT